MRLRAAPTPLVCTHTGSLAAHDIETVQKLHIAAPIVDVHSLNQLLGQSAGNPPGDTRV